MTRSVEELRGECERSRAEFAVTVDRLRERISDTADDLRHKVSPQHIKSEVSDYISNKTQSWVEALKQQAMDNPMQAVAAGTAVAIPLLRLARGFPLPLLMIGAGLALTSKTVRERAAEAAAPVMEKAGEMLDQPADRVDAPSSDMRDRLNSAQSQASDMASDAQDAAAALADDLGKRAAQAAGTVGDTLKSGMDAVKGRAGAVKDAAATAPAKARQFIGDNAALIAGLGIAIGAILAAALPETTAEAKAMGPASDSVKRAAGGAAQSGFEAAKDATMSAADAAARSVGEADLGGHASRMTEDVADRLKEAADDVVRAAFSPSPNPNT
ncbi:MULTISPECIES: DUF3618 domain-containing protein [Bradyrhizobium]|jgi:ElaB/YqjD/DUF883 family membrane-anchored ribosome-binding protein|uniref:DUF3618 domain-containing protein n=2 Tax=Nitrobacteraceae TaxID=41294 RepID=UPI002167813F|nr:MULTISPECIES: DUF3618 domain-containing protein [Bradyrhizobium]MCS3447341.1 ElaB/YqjD/DUF883 family membrane-anchored ribosome-binding protein [Bradyrhizobium elkanii]MCS3561522.1 ElaB/YqjD/DUF883 family membrane-anchored ribosome-binding protein [Bradyrhizobium elkanii]MCW2148636.1 ElaB/YqjD/DUF883 family membrane-anchored ribosome-binding protein [Bradyrhizobium elkanii]MCW2352277.1 ElaB/YqjD/DUF883 family membrane-anchored ribosome-binding protein [Bradyrhizobium elkanii]MCW2372365.1 El